MSVLKLNALGYKAILFLGHHDRNGQINGDMIHFLEPAEGAAQDIIMKMSKLYEHLLSKLCAHQPASAEMGTAATGPVPPVQDDSAAGVAPVAEEYNAENIVPRKSSYTKALWTEEL
ncbi:uncharacterized protein LOC143740155 isoform X1 [Siphateles boraxobius]|uniref:uncharacterized protein LOC143740155 isoform X1 n=1 Tax=Siphateles boraxobius TaxID=180520 RepID=UPI0040646506